MRSAYRFLLLTHSLFIRQAGRKNTHNSFDFQNSPMLVPPDPVVALNSETQKALVLNYGYCAAGQGRFEVFVRFSH